MLRRNGRHLHEEDGLAGTRRSGGHCCRRDRLPDAPLPATIRTFDDEKKWRDAFPPRRCLP